MLVVDGTSCALSTSHVRKILAHFGVLWDSIRVVLAFYAFVGKKMCERRGWVSYLIFLKYFTNVCMVDSIKEEG